MFLLLKPLKSVVLSPGSQRRLMHQGILNQILEFSLFVYRSAVVTHQDRRVASLMLLVILTSSAGCLRVSGVSSEDQVYMVNMGMEELLRGTGQPSLCYMQTVNHSTLLVVGRMCVVFWELAQ